MKRAFAGACFASLTVVGTSAHAQETSTFDVDPYGALPAHELVSATTTQTPGHLGWGAGLVFSYADDQLQLARGEETISRLVGHQGRAALWGTLGLADWVQIDLGLPLVVTQGGDDLGVVGRPGTSLEGGSLGDLHVAAKAAPAFGLPVGLALQLGAHLPTGGRDSFASDGGVRLEPRLVVDWSGASVRTAMNAGYVARPRRTLRNHVSDDAIRWALAGEIAVGRPLYAVVSAFGTIQLAGDSEVGGLDPDGIGKAGSPAEALAALRLRTDSGLAAELGMGMGLNRQVGAPDFRILVGVSFTASSGDTGGVAVEDGAADTDGDGVSNALDRCPAHAEDVDGFQDGDGCPDLDHDADGIPEPQDRCPDTAGTEELGGCPAGDADEDGVLDVADACKDVKEDRDGIDDEDGCPETDHLIRGNGTFRPTRPMTFDKLGKPTESSILVLNELTRLLRADKGFAKVSVEVHVFDSDDAERNQQVSQARATGIREYLLSAGFQAHEVEATGLGDTRKLGGVEAGSRVDFVVRERTKYRRLQQ